MKKLFILLLIGFSSSAFAGQCFSLQTLRDWKYVARNTVQVHVSSKRVFELKTYSCPGLRWADRIGFRTWPRNSSTVCKGDEILILGNFDNRVQESCPIRLIERVK